MLNSSESLLEKLRELLVRTTQHAPAAGMSNETIEQWTSLCQSIESENRQLSALSEIAIGMFHNRSPATLLDHIAQSLVELSSANSACLYMVHETGDYLSAVAGSAPLDESLCTRRIEKNAGLLGRCWASEAVQLGTGCCSMKELKLAAGASCQYAAIPMVAAGRILGVALVIADEGCPLGDEISLLSRLAETGAISVFYSRQREATVNELERTQVLRQLSSLMHDHHDWHQMARQVCPKLFDVLDLFRASLYYADPETQLFRSYLSWEVCDEEVIQSDTIDDRLIQETISAWAYEYRLPAMIKRGVEDKRESAAVYEFRRTREIGSTLCAPVMSEDTVWGLLTVCRHMNKRDFDENDYNTFQTVTGQMSTALQRHKLLEAVRYQALHDELTGLPNRRAFEDQVSKLCSVGKEDTPLCAVFFLDLDGFKDINDTMGHAVGDEVLKAVADRLSERMNEECYLARLGGDEFAILMHNIMSERQATRFAELLTTEFSRPFAIDSGQVDVATSIGISFFPCDGTSREELIMSADIAMYQAKRNGRNQFVQFDQQLATRSREEIVRRTDLKKAISRDQLELWYQPQMALSTMKVAGVEALIRWRHPVQGMIPPWQFIPLAEESGLISQIGSWVVEQSCAQIQRWQKAGAIDWHVSINVAAPQLIDSRFSRKVIGTIEALGIQPQQVQLEVTESAFMTDLNVVLLNLAELRAAGVRIAIDDFGTGFSSLKYLQELPLDVLKIDRAFISSLSKESVETSLASTIMLLADRFGLETVAEGVETLEQLELVGQMGCDLVQGYIFSRPVRAGDVIATVDQLNSITPIARKCA